MLSRSVVSDSYDPTDCSQPGTSIHGILQARMLEWVAMPSSRGSSQPRNQTRVSCIAGGFFYQLSYQGRPLPDDKQLKKADIVYETTDFGQYAAQECDPRQK